MNWGTKIVIAFAIFVTGMVAMVIYVANLQMDLVEDNYYESEIKYQDQIDMLNATEELENALRISYLGNDISFTFPEQSSMPTGEINFYRPSDSGKDFRVNIKTNEYREQTISSANLAQGLWRIQVTWYADNSKFFKEEKFYID